MFTSSMHTKMQRLPTADRLIISRMIQRAFAENADGTGPAMFEARNKAERRFLDRYKTRSAPPQTIATIGMWQKHGAGIYHLNQIIPAILGRLEIPFSERGGGIYKLTQGESVRTRSEDGTVNYTALRSSEAHRNFRDLIERTNRPEGCVVFSFGTYGDKQGIHVSSGTREGEDIATRAHHRAAAREKSFGKITPLSDVRVISATLRWHDKHILGWHASTRVQLSVEWDIADSGNSFFTCLGVSDDSVVTALDFNGDRMPGQSTHHLHVLLFQSVVEALSGLLTKRIVYTKQASRGRKGIRGRRRTSRNSVKTCLLDVALWNQYVRRTNLRLVSTSGGSSSTAPSSKYDGPSYTVGVITRGMWVLEKNVKPGEEWLDIRESKAGNVLVLVKRECNHEGYTVSGSGEPSLRLVQPIRA